MVSQSSSDIKLPQGGDGCQVEPSPLIYLRGSESAENVLDKEQRIRRFYVKCRDGILVAQALGYSVRWFTLTESDYAIGMELDWGVAVNKFNGKMRYDYGRDVGFCWVEHLQGTKQRFNWHYVDWGTTKLDARVLGEYWLKVYGSLISGMKLVDNAHECAHYLASYVAGEGFQRARFSYNWVFPRWFDYSRWVKREFGRYPDVYELAQLSVMSPAERVSNSFYGLWLESESRKSVCSRASRFESLTPSREARRLIYEYGKTLKSWDYVEDVKEVKDRFTC